MPKSPEDDLVLALPSHRFTSAGPGDWWCLVHVDGFLIEIGDEKRARQIAAEINAGRAALREREGEDVVEAAARALVPFAYGSFEHQIDRDGNRVQPALQPNDRARKAVRAILPIIALAARDAALEAAAVWHDAQEAEARVLENSTVIGAASRWHLVASEHKRAAAHHRALKGGPARG